jgi:hypothetical protein
MVEPEAQEGIRVMAMMEVVPMVVVPMVVVPMVVPMVVAPLVPMRAVMEARRGCTHAMTPKRAPARRGVCCAQHHHEKRQSTTPQAP